MPPTPTRTFKQYTAGTHRALPPSTLLVQLTPLLRLAGITRLANITGLDCIGMPTVCAIRPAALTLSVAAGKGLSVEWAKVSAIMEALEFFSAETTQIPEFWCTTSQVGAHRTMSLGDYAPCASNAPLSWTIGIDLTSGDSVLLPTDLVVLGRQTQSIKSFLSSSHGLAAGAVLVEAVLVGVLEVIEKHAVRAARNPARVIPDYLNALPIVGQLCQQIEEAGAELAVYDCSSRLGIPVYFARVWDAREPYAGVYSGSGAHLDPEIAVLRAITEAVQSRAVYIAGARDDLPSRAFEQHRAHASPSIIDRLRRQPSTATVDLAHAPSATTQTFEGDMNVVLGRLEAAELHECIAVDLTPPEFSKIASVVRVVVPGLAA